MFSEIHGLANRLTFSLQQIVNFMKVLPKRKYNFSRVFDTAIRYISPSKWFQLSWARRSESNCNLCCCVCYDLLVITSAS